MLGQPYTVKHLTFPRSVRPRVLCVLHCVDGEMTFDDDLHDFTDAFRVRL